MSSRCLGAGGDLAPVPAAGDDFLVLSLLRLYSALLSWAGSERVCGKGLLLKSAWER